MKMWNKIRGEDKNKMEQVIPKQLLLALENDDEEEIYEKFDSTTVNHRVKLNGLTVFEYLMTMKQSENFINKYIDFFLRLGYNPKYMSNRIIKYMIIRYENGQCKEAFHKLLSKGLDINYSHLVFCIERDFVNCFRYLMNIGLVLDDEIQCESLVVNASLCPNLSFLETLIEKKFNMNIQNMNIQNMNIQNMQNMKVQSTTESVLYNIINNINLALEHNNLLPILRFVSTVSTQTENSLYVALIKNFVYNSDSTNLETFKIIFDFIEEFHNHVTSKIVQMSVCKFNPYITNLLILRAYNINKESQAPIYETIINYNTIENALYLLKLFKEHGFKIDIDNQKNIPIKEIFFTKYGTYNGFDNVM